MFMTVMGRQLLSIDRPVSQSQCADWWLLGQVRALVPEQGRQARERWLCFPAQSAGFAGLRLLCLQKVLCSGGHLLVRTVAAVVEDAAIMDSRLRGTHLWLAAQQSAVGDQARWAH